MSESKDKREKDDKGPGPKHVFHIRIDRIDYKIPNEVMTGAQLRRLPDPDVGPDRDLFLVVPNGTDKKIGNDEDVKMHDGQRFFTAPAQINPGRS